MIATPTTCPFCRGAVQHIADDRHRCHGCRRLLRLVAGLSGEQFVPWLDWTRAGTTAIRPNRWQSRRRKSLQTRRLE